MNCKHSLFTVRSLGSSLLVAAAALSGCALPEPETSAETASTAQAIDTVSSQSRDGGCTWSQWGRSAGHDGQSCARGQEPSNILHHLVYDPFEFQEMAEGGGDLFIHYQAPLNDDDGNFYMLQKGGTYTPCDPPGSGTPDGCGIDPRNLANEIWSENKYRRHGRSFEQVWSFASDWKPYPVFLWEPMFQPALAGPLLYVPGAGGSVFQVLNVLDHPVVLQRINPFDTIDPNTYVTSGITIDRFGFAYWNAIQFDPATFENRGFLVKAAPWGQTWKVDYETLIPGAPAEFDSCFYVFAFERPAPPRPWPPSADAVPPEFICGRQRPGVNVTPAIGRDGTIFTASTADFAFHYAYIVALNPDLSLKWATSLRGLVNDGCGVHRPDSPEGDVRCSTTFSAVGVDPNTNMPPALIVDDVSSSSPVALPDGGVMYGALDDYNFARGHLVRLDADGRFAAAFGFGWDSTPAVYEHDGTYSIVIKDNHYLSDGPFLVSQLTKDMQIEWSFQNTSTQACTRQPDGTLTCTDTTADGEEHPNGFEWCVNAPAVDARGNVYVNAEDGFVYQIGQGGVLKTQTFLNQALGAAYTPISLDPRGRIYTLNNGELTVFGRGGENDD
jgi:hypothetical protein